MYNICFKSRINYVTCQENSETVARECSHIIVKELYILVNKTYNLYVNKL